MSDAHSSDRTAKRSSALLNLSTCVTNFGCQPGDPEICTALESQWNNAEYIVQLSALMQAADQVKVNTDSAFKTWVLSWMLQKLACLRVKHQKDYHLLTGLWAIVNRIGEQHQRQFTGIEVTLTDFCHWMQLLNQQVRARSQN